ncbi:MAG: hypothetical protein JXR64_02960 [Spirochaetales bacterium]|nr:hypothetical protein [Spirochaetales bacterium]
MRKDNTNTEDVVEVTVTAKIDGMYFLRNHQYEYVRSYEGMSSEFNKLYKREQYHVVLIDNVEYPIPESICTLTNVLKTELEQNMNTYIEVTRRDNIVERFDTYVKSLPIAETEETFGKPNHTGESYKQRLLKLKGDV